jgi:metal-sulfur cluster biosynthetic enzyme
MPNSILMNQDSVLEALREVIDPELGENLVDLGLIYAVRTIGKRIEVDLTLTTPGCPLHASLHAAAERAIRLMVPGAEEVQITGLRTALDSGAHEHGRQTAAGLHVSYERP